MLAQSQSVNSRYQFHNPLAANNSATKTTKPSRPIGDFCSVTTRLDHKSKKVSRGIVSRARMEESFPSSFNARQDAISPAEPEPLVVCAYAPGGR